MTKEISYEIVEEIGVLSYTGSWSLELNRIAWNGGAPKYDIRKWNADHSRMGKGVTLTDTEMDELIALVRGE
jgi:hypothetical protein